MKTLVAIFFLLFTAKGTDKQCQTEIFHPNYQQITTATLGYVLPLNLQTTQHVIMPNLGPEDQMKFKMTAIRFNKLKLIGSLNIVPNEGSIKLYRDFETGKFTWVDSEKLISIKERDFIENQLGQEGAHKANVIFEWFASCIYCYYKGDAKLFIQKLLAYMSLIVDVDMIFDHVHFNGRFKNALGVAIFYDAAEAVENILNRGVNVNFPSKWFLPSSPMETAISWGSTQAFSKLLEKGANTESDLESSKICSHCSFQIESDLALKMIGYPCPENAKLLAILLEQRPSFNLNSRYWYFDCRGYTLLNKAAYYNNIESVKLLIKAGADLNIPENEHGWTPLMTSAHEGNSEILKLLYKAGANLHLKDAKGDTALNIAINAMSTYKHESGQSKCVKLIRGIKSPKHVGAKAPNHIGTMVKN